MSLIETRVPQVDDPIPATVLEFLREAEHRIDEFQRQACYPGFVASDFPRVYQTLRAVRDGNLANGRLFCEWGSGFGVVACLAAMLDFDALGIEIEAELIDHARKLAGDFALPVNFVQGSYIPRGAESLADIRGSLAWLITEKTGAAMGLDPDDFDVIYAYPWPDERGVTERLFERYASEQALLVTYHTDGPVRVRRKRGKRKRNSV